MQVHDEFSGTITLTENSSRELFKVLKEQDEAFINDVLDGRCGFTLKSADGRSVELVPNTNKRCQCVGSVGADRKTENSSEKPNNCEDFQDWKDRMWAEAIVTEPTISKMEQVDEPKWTKENCKGCKYNEYPYDSGTCFVRVCINGNKYEPKDEPQTCSVNGRPYDCGNCEYHKCTADEPQTERGGE